MKKIFFNGREGSDFKLSVLTKAFQYGKGLFETILVEEGRPVFLKEHLERLKTGIKLFWSRFPFDNMEEEIRCFLKLNSFTAGILKIIVFEESDDIDYLLIFDDNLPYYTRAYDKGILLTPFNVARDGRSVFYKLKTLSFIENLVTKEAAEKRNAHEAVLVNADGSILECSFSNLFVKTGGRICTPPDTEPIFPGITRSLIIKHAARCQERIYEKKITKTDLAAATEIFVTSSLKGVMPVYKIEGIFLNTGEDETTARIADMYEKLKAADMAKSLFI